MTTAKQGKQIQPLPIVGNRIEQSAQSLDLVELSAPALAVILGSQSSRVAGPVVVSIPARARGICLELGQPCSLRM